MPSSRSKKQAPPLEETSPVLLSIAKRLRNTRKRLRGLEELQAKADAGKELNPDQVRPGRARASIGRVVCLWALRGVKPHAPSRLTARCRSRHCRARRACWR